MSRGTETRSSAILTVEDQVLLSCIAAVRDWIRDVTEWGFPRFGELGMRLLPLRDLLASELGRSTAGVENAAGSFDAGTDSATVHGAAESTEVDTTHVRSRRQRVLEPLEMLITRLQSGEPAFRSWQDAVEQVDWIFLEVCRNAQDADGE